jgi:hypothetical protein
MKIAQFELRLGLPNGGNLLRYRRGWKDRFVTQSSLLRRGARLPVCSEVIETSSGKFKTLEREQANGGFTGLLLGLAG